MKAQRGSNRSGSALFWSILIVAAILAVLPLVPPAPPASPDVADFSVDNALELIEKIAVEPRPIGSPGNQRGREKIVAQLRSIGLEPEFQTFTVANYFSREREPIELVNILARIPGTDSTSAVALTGHHDTVPTTFGANDDTSAVAIMLETARAILAGPPLRNDVILLFIDGEEPAPRFGSAAFVERHPWFDDIGFVLNLEAIGSRGPSLIVEMNGPGKWMIEQYVEAVPFPAAFSFITTLSSLMGGSNTDFATFRDAGVTGFDVAYLTGSPIYHTMADAPDNMSARSVYQHGANALALARHMGNLDLDENKMISNSTFFTLGRSWVLQYPTAWMLPVSILVGVLLVGCAWQHGGWLRVLRGFGATLLSALLSVAVSIGIWTQLGRWRGTMGISESYLYLAGFVALVVTIGALASRLTRRRIGTAPDALGVLIVWWLLGLATAILAPGMSYLFVWPALAGAVGLLPRSTGGRLWLTALRWGLVSVLTLVVLVPAIDFFYQFAQPRPGNLDSQILALIAIPALLVSLVAELLRVFRVRTTS